MAIVTVSDFTLNQALPVAELGSILQEYIDKYEPEILDRMLSRQLSVEFSTEIAKATPDPEWIELRDGADYTYQDILYKFNGLKIAATNYIYYMFVSQNQEYAASVGMKRIKSENSEAASPANKLRWAYDEMVDINKELFWFITVKNIETQDTYENYIETEIVKVNNLNL